MHNRQENHFLHFSRSERNGILVLIFISILCRIVPYFIETFQADNPQQVSLQEWQSLKLLADTPARYTNYKRDSAEYISEAELFNFDPNTIGVEDWKKLGVSERTATSIRKYISKGARFYKPDDIRKIYGLKPGKADELIPYVRIVESGNYVFPAKEYKKYSPQQRIVDVNRADSVMFESLPGIGPTLARRIIVFREKLGGFYSITQVAETYGLPDSTFQKIKASLRLAPFEVRKISINTADKETLESHPYIRYKVASLIVAYRLQHGNFDHVDDLKSIPAITEETLNKMQPYLEVTD